MYWMNEGKEQAKYDEMVTAGWEFSKKTEAVFHSYYRYYNDGDAPARIRWLKQMLGPYGSQDNSEIRTYEARLEAKATERIEIEYRRFRKAQAAQHSNREGGI